MLTMNQCCQRIGAPCTGTFIRRCCGDLQCEYDTLEKIVSAAQTTVNFLSVFETMKNILMLNNHFSL
uniref:Uncharacterized protein n=1 Tax=Trichobilharzia regenti TaxID=157069 RepID=A0AA85J2P2_TRIRE|nr:unnamed protein product [Trichobilharzia regenti]